MAVKKITKRVVDALSGDVGDAYLWDAELKGFGVKRTANGRKTFVVQYRMGGRGFPSKRYTIGQYGSPWTPDGARKTAEKILADVKRGVDPATEKAAKRKELTISEACNRYLDEHVAVHNRPGTAREARQNVENYINPKFGGVRLTQLSRPMVRGWHAAMKNTPYQANRCLATLSKVMSLCIAEWDLLSQNPASGIKKFAEAKRGRFLSPRELAKLGETLSSFEERGENPVAIGAIRLLALTGCRKNEILTLKKDWVDYDAAMLRLPKSKTGAKVVHLGAPALDLLASLSNKFDGPYVFPSGRGDGHFVGLQKVWERVRSVAELADVRIHDLRHSHGGVAASGGDSLLVIGALLGHQNQSTTQRYAHLADDPVKASADRVSRQISAAMDGGDGDVVQIDRKRRTRQ
jgi:integrase